METIAINSGSNRDHPGRLLLVDGHAYAYRAFYAIRALNSPDGRPTNAIYGFIKMLARMRSILAPTHLLVVWDGGLAAERMEMHSEYKQQRAEMPGDLECQLDEITEFLEASAIGSIVHDGTEADDWIATIARHATEAGLEVVIASADKDFMQLVSDRVSLFNPNDKSETLWGASQVREKTGVAPEQIVDWLSLIGDSVDNIGGVPGVGPKTATDLLNQFANVGGIYSRLDEIKSERLRANLAASDKIVRRNQELIRLRNDLPFESCFTSMAIGAGNAAVLRELYVRWGFKSLVRELDEAADRELQLF